MSILDKVEIIKNILAVVIKIADILLTAVNTVIEKIGDVK